VLLPPDADIVLPLMGPVGGRSLVEVAGVIRGSFSKRNGPLFHLSFRRIIRRVRPPRVGPCGSSLGIEAFSLKCPAEFTTKPTPPPHPRVESLSRLPDSFSCGSETVSF